MTKKSNIKKQVQDIQDLLSVYEPSEINNYLHSLSFNYEFISLCSEIESLDSLLSEAISESFSNCCTVYDTLTEMIDLLA